MKRIIAGMLLLALLLTCAAAGAEDGKSYASGFKLRQGLSFGATAADVAAAEKLTQLFGDQKTVYGDLQYKGTIAGLQDGLVGYFIDENNRLNEMWYRFEPTSLSHGYEIYNYLLTNLQEKYGEPMEDLGGSYRAVAGTLTQKAGPWIECREWMIPVDDCYVKIDLMMSNRAFFTTYIRFVMVDYTTFTAEEVETKLNQYEMKYNSILDDL